jgi:quercetin dioxygenase-like cupin family protein
MRPASCSPARITPENDLKIALAADDFRRARSQALRVSHDHEGELAMFHAGDQIENPVTGERLVFHETSAETNGERVVFETIVRPGGFVAAAHVHPFQTERFEVLAGRLGMKQGRAKAELVAGDVAVVEPGTPHRFWNAGDGEVRFVCTVTPALRFEQLIETMYALAVAGKTNRKGMPSPLRLAVIANRHFDDVRLPLIPQPLQKLGLALGAPAGRLLGFGEPAIA